VETRVRSRRLADAPDPSQWGKAEAVFGRCNPVQIAQPWFRRRSTQPGGRVAGQYTRHLVLRLRMRTLLTLGLFAVFTVVIGRFEGYHHVLFEVAEIALLCACFAVTRWVLPIVERYDRGAAGEELVGSILEELRPEGWDIIHDAELEHSNVDHIVLGPGGLFTVETKSNPGPIRVQRLHGRLIRQVQLQRERVEAIAGTTAEPLLVYSRARVDRPGRRRKGIRVLEAHMLPAYLEERPAILDEAQVNELRHRLRSAFDG